MLCLPGLAPPQGRPRQPARRGSGSAGAFSPPTASACSDARDLDGLVVRTGPVVGVEVGVEERVDEGGVITRRRRPRCGGHGGHEGLVACQRTVVRRDLDILPRAAHASHETQRPRPEPSGTRGLGGTWAGGRERPPHPRLPPEGSGIDGRLRDRGPGPAPRAWPGRRRPCRRWAARPRQPVLRACGAAAAPSRSAPSRSGTAWIGVAVTTSRPNPRSTTNHR